MNVVCRQGQQHFGSRWQEQQIGFSPYSERAGQILEPRGELMYCGKNENMELDHEIVGSKEKSSQETAGNFSGDIVEHRPLLAHDPPRQERVTCRWRPT